MLSASLTPKWLLALGALVAVAAVVGIIIWRLRGNGGSHGGKLPTRGIVPDTTRDSDIDYHGYKYAVRARNKHKSRRLVMIRYEVDKSDVDIGDWPQFIKNERELKVMPPRRDQSARDHGVITMADHITVFTELDPGESLVLNLNKMNAAVSWTNSIPENEIQRYYFIAAPYSTQAETSIAMDANQVNSDKSFVHGVSEDMEIKYFDTTSRGYIDSMHQPAVKWPSALLENMVSDYGCMFDVGSGVKIPMIPSDMYIGSDEIKHCVMCAHEDNTDKYNLVKIHRCRVNMHSHMDAIDAQLTGVDEEMSSIDEDLPFCTFVKKVNNLGENVGYCWTYGELECSDNKCGYPFTFDEAKPGGGAGLNAATIKILSQSGQATFESPCELPENVSNEPALTCPNCLSTAVDPQITSSGGVLVVEFCGISQIESIATQNSPRVINNSVPAELPKTCSGDCS